MEELQNVGKHAPTQEEQEKALLNATEAQLKLTQLRNASSEELKKLGVNGYLEGVAKGENIGTNIQGIINGHKIEIDVETNSEKGTIDGLELSRLEVMKLIRKYANGIVNYTKEDLENAKKSVSEERRKEILKEIGL